MSTDRARRKSAPQTQELEQPVRSLRVRPPPSTSVPVAAASGEQRSPGPGTPTPRKRVRVAQTPEVMERVRQSAAYIFFTDLVERLYVKPEAEGFRAPVLDLWEESAVPGYLDIIRTPMDLGTVKARLKDGFYNRFHQTAPFIDEKAVMRDVRLVFQNCMNYNDSESDFYDLAKELLAFANKAVKPRIIQRGEEERRKEESQRERKLQRDRERRARIKAERMEDAKRTAESEERERELALRKKRKRERDNERRAEKKARDMEEKRVREAERRARLKAQKLAAAEARAAQEAAALEAARPAFPDTPRPVVRRRRDDDDRSTSSISSDEVAEIEEEIEVDDEESLEARHDELMRQRRQLVEARVELDRRRHVQLTDEDKNQLCAKVRVLGFLQMKCVSQLIAHGMNRLDMLSEKEVDIDVDRVDTHVLREVQFFLENPPLAKALHSLSEIERTLTSIE
eukprot:IDg10098t1